MSEGGDILVTRDELSQYLETNYETKAEYLWDKFPDYAVFRHKNEGKWFGLVMDVLPEKFDLEGDEELDVLNVKSPPEINGSLQKREDIFEAYHMDKEHWISIVLNRVDNIEDIEGFIEKSFELTKE